MKAKPEDFTDAGIDTAIRMVDETIDELQDFRRSLVEERAQRLEAAQ